MITVSYHTFFNRHYEILRGYIGKIVNNREDSEELTIDAFMHIFEKWTDYNTEEHARRVLFICGKFYSLNHLQAQGRQKRRHTVELRPWMELDEVELVEIEFDDIICHALHALPSGAKEVFLLLMQGMTRSEVAQQLGISEHTVKNQRARAIKSIQSFINNKT